MLYTPASQFVNEYDDTTAGSASITVVGTGIAATAGAAHTKGSWAQIVSATDRDWYGFWLMTSSAAGTNTVNSAQLVDIGIGAGGSEVVLLADYVSGFQVGITSTVTTGPVPPLFFPIFIPKGTRIACRTQNFTASRVARIHLWGESGSSLPRAVFSGCDTYGANTAASTGVNISTNATANTFGSWTNVGGTTSRDYGGFAVSSQCFASTTVNARSFVIEFGYNSTAFMRMMAASTTVEAWTVFMMSPPIVRNIPSGTQLQARASCANNSNTETPSVAFHCFY